MTAPTIKVNGTLVSEAALRALMSVRIDRPLGVVGRAVLRFTDESFTLTSSATFKVGSTVSVAAPAGGAVLFEGAVSALGVEQVERASPELSVTVDDAAGKLASSSFTGSYAKMSYVQVLTKLVQRHGLAITATGLSSATQDYLLQSGSELAFLEELTTRLNAVWYVDPARPSALKLVPVGQATGKVQLTLVEDLLRFSVRASGAQPGKVRVTGWDRQSTALVVGESPKAAASDIALVKAAKDNSPRSSATTLVAERTPSTKAEADLLAQSLFAESQAASVVVRGTVLGTGAIDLMTTVEITDTGPAKGSYIVTAVEHVYDRRGFLTTFTAGPHRPASLVDTLGPGAPSGVSLNSLVVGVVTNHGGPDNPGQVKVKYAGVSDTLESAWARVVIIGGGKDRGMLFLPEVNDEVLVGFERGDTRFPVVLGGLHSKKNPLPGATAAVAAAKVEHRRITSRVGHVIELSDEQGKEHILLKMSNGSHKIDLATDGLAIEVADGKPIKITNGKASIELTAAGDVVIKGMNLKLESQTNTEVTANAQLKVKATGPATVEGAMVTVKGQSTAELSSAGMTTVKGGSVMIN